MCAATLLQAIFVHYTLAVLYAEELGHLRGHRAVVGSLLLARFRTKEAVLPQSGDGEVRPVLFLAVLLFLPNMIQDFAPELLVRLEGLIPHGVETKLG